MGTSRIIRQVTRIFAPVSTRRIIMKSFIRIPLRENGMWSMRMEPPSDVSLRRLLQC